MMTRGTITRLLCIQFPRLYSKVSVLGKSGVLISNFPSVLLLNEVWFVATSKKSCKKITVRLGSKIFQNVITITLHENPCFLYAMTYLCFKCNSFVLKSMCVIG